MNNSAVYSLLGPAEPAVPVVLDSPHSGHHFPADFGAQVGEYDLRESEDTYVDELYLPATTKGVALLAANFPRTFIDVNRHEGDIDLALLDGAWPHELRPSGKAEIGKALIWRTLSDGRDIYAARLRPEQVLQRIAQYHRPYHEALQRLLNASMARHGQVFHINCHSMASSAGVMGVGQVGEPRADFVLGDRDGSSCGAAFTELVYSQLRAKGYDVAINKPYKGVELVRAYSNPAQRRHSLQIEVNKRLYMDETTRAKTAGFAQVQKDLMEMIQVLIAFTGQGTQPRRQELQHG
ncbi:MAG: N-formylglutamate amidohydrolase [Burkholderiaceae bacterium]|nr:N-formylglutamate amidohydrolase [Burkholderiaceae bacterium]